MYRLGVIALLLLGLAVGRSWGAEDSSDKSSAQKAGDPNALDAALKNLQGKTAELKSYQVNMDYVFKQPLLESQQRRKGVLYYAKLDDKSYLRIDFRTLQQDEEKEQAYLQQYFFDGVWLWEVDHQLKAATCRQLTEPNEPIDALSLAGRHLPVLGFSNTDDLRRQFEITLVADPQGPAATSDHLHLKVRPDSVYKDDYVTLDFWIDRKIGLPVRVGAVTPEEDAYEIRLANPKVNTEINPKLFRVDVPRDFSKETIPLSRRAREKQPG
ncbi:MAG: hypothetical protein A2Y76_15940 [Planctomycetes bacterium RBG_13_60_9]|nr:MAG: hypothetical protein A2Y76_15940 [Planctomycetes bacterium RBG_13_60_9]